MLHDVVLGQNVYDKMYGMHGWCWETVEGEEDGGFWDIPDYVLH